MVYCRPGDLARLATVGSGVEVRKSGIPNGGNGLFAARDFQPKELVTEYCGEIISRDDAVSVRAEDPSEVSHFRSLGYHQVIAGYKDKEEAVGKGGASFANDGTLQKKNNAKLKSFEMRHTLQVRVFLVADRLIKAGEEILTAYGKDYWKPTRPAPAATASKQSENHRPAAASQPAAAFNMFRSSKKGVQPKAAAALPAKDSSPAEQKTRTSAMGMDTHVLAQQGLV